MPPSEKKRKKRPRQPPPPASLVNLIQSDPQVLSYFQSLQANLQLDVQIWKDRAEEYKSENEKLRKLKAPRKRKLQEKAKDTRPNPPVAEVVEPVPDDMFDVSDSEEDTSDQSKAEDRSLEEETAQSPEEAQAERLTRVAESIPWMVFAYEKLAHLGAPLLDNDGKSRSDEDVVGDLLHTIRAVTRFQLGKRDLEQAYPPFSLEAMIPCCDEGYDKDHPANHCKRLVFAVLFILDTFDYRDVGSLPDPLRTAFRGRGDLVESLLQSLHGEIAHAWAIQDRAERLQTTSLHWRDDVENPVSTTSSFGIKSHSRLSHMIERCILVQIVAGLYLARNDISSYQRIVADYVLANIPTADETARLPPTLSLVLLEAMLQPKTLWWESDFENVLDPEGFFGRMLAVSTGIVGRLWKRRLVCHDDRIYDVARVEVACWDRMNRLKVYRADAAGCEDVSSLIADLRSAVELDDSLRVQILAVGHLASNAASLFLPPLGSIHTPEDPVYVESLCLARRGFQLRCLDVHRDNTDKQDCHVPLVSVEPWAALCIKCLDYVQSSVSGPRVRKRALLHVVQSAIALADGRLILNVVENAKLGLFSFEDLACESAILQDVARVPLVRVINLDRRRDRLAQFHSMAACDRICVVKALPFIDADTSSADFYFGRSAIDGKYGSRLVDAIDHLASVVGCMDELVNYVSLQWRPHDLKPFDSGAPETDSLVHSSSSELACALSHIFSWQGAMRSLSVPMPQLASPLDSMTAKFLRLLRITGFAEGPALDSKNSRMLPSPVCVILEDDAILCDRFADRLGELLNDLPRDFHFCSIGYGRPKSAPLVPYTDRVSIPTGLWYMTGYIVSDAGVRFLLDNLPVVGPIDAWISLRIVSNWDNLYGDALGVGSKPTETYPSRSELTKILKFRAYCASKPLCWQQVGEGNWRSNRDTDIEYSGHRSR